MIGNCPTAPTKAMSCCWVHFMVQKKGRKGKKAGEKEGRKEGKISKRSEQTSPQRRYADRKQTCKRVVDIVYIRKLYIKTAVKS